MIAAASSLSAPIDQRASSPAPAQDPKFGKAMEKARDDRPASDADKPQSTDDPKSADAGAAGSPPPAQPTADAAIPPAVAPDALANAQAMLAALAGQAGMAKPGATARAATQDVGAAVASAAEAKLAGAGKAGGADAADTDGAAVAVAADPGAGEFQQIVAAFTGAPDKGIGDAAGIGTSAAAPLGEAAITHHLDLAKDSAWLDRLAKDIAASADQSGQLRFSLSPERLGRLDVAVAQGADGTTIRLTAETREAQRIIADAQPQLVAEARAQGLRVSETSVDLNNSGSGGGQAQAFGNQNARGEGQQSQRAPWQAPDASASVSDTRAAPRGEDELYA